MAGSCSAPTATSGRARSPSSTRRCASWPPSQRLELALADAQRLGLAHGDAAVVSANGTKLSAKVAIRERHQEGSCFLVEGTAEDNANALLNGGPRSVKVEKAP